MAQIWNKVLEVDPSDLEAVKDVVNTFFQNSMKTGESNSITWLCQLRYIINRFPRHCMPLRSTIEDKLAASIDSNDCYYVIEAAKCAHAIQQVRPLQEKTATPKTSWVDQMNLLCNAAHSLISAIFPNAVDIYKDLVNGKNQKSSNSSLTTILLNITSVSGSHTKGNKMSLLQTRLRNVFYFIQAMLVEVYPVAKSVRPQAILDLIMRALSVSGGTKRADIDVSVIKIEALRTLDAVVACLGSNLIPFSPLVFRLLMQTFRWCTENTVHKFSKVRCSAYKSLGHWLNTLRCHRSASDSRTCWEDDLAHYILNDTAPPEKLVQLTLGEQPTKHMSKKAKRKLANSRLLESSIASHMPCESNKNSMPEEINNEVTMAALECAEIFLLVCGRFLKPKTHELLQLRAIRESYNAHKYNEERLMSLLRVVEASRKTVPSGIPLPTQHCLQLYSALGSAAHGEISKFCTQALLDIRLHLHCSPPSLNFDLEAPQEKQSSTNKRKKVSEKNRAALESLLGPDRYVEVYRMPILDNQEEIITIPDEPSSKKQRLAEELDKISVSSGSISSVEISDDSDIEEVPVDETDGEADGWKEVTSVSVDIVTVEKSNEDNGSNLVDNNITDTIEPMVVEDKIIAPIQENLYEKPVTVTSGDDVPIVESESVDGKVKNIDITVNRETFSIHEAPTQMPLNISTETIYGGEGPLSLEVAYDYPSTGQATVNILDKIDDEVLPSTNETDDAMITCGQFVNNSQEVYLEKKSDDADMSEAEVNEVPNINGNATENDIVENGADIPIEKTEDENVEEIKAISKDGTVSIEAMMADFVDEINEDATVT